jgi:hypothetical protein
MLEYWNVGMVESWVIVSDLVYFLAKLSFIPIEQTHLSNIPLFQN